MLSIRSLDLREMVFPMEVAYNEGWNPGLYDGASFYQTDPEGFLLAEWEGGMVGGISAVRHCPGLMYIGGHFVLPPYRGKGYGKALWEAALDKAGDDESIVINGLTEGRDFYESYGFSGVCNVIRYTGAIYTRSVLSDRVTDARDLDFDRLASFDSCFFGALRKRFLRAWLEMPAMDSGCLIIDGELRAWGCIRRCRIGWQLGPLYALDYESAQELARHLSAKTISDEVTMDIPEQNIAAIQLAFSMGMVPVSARLRMYRNSGSDEALDDVYGFATLDVG